VPLIRALIKQRSRDDWMARMDQAGVPSGAIRSVGEVCDGDLLQARDMIAAMPHPNAGTVKAVKNPMHLSATPLEGYAAPPMLGQHTREVLTELLGYAAADLEKLARDKVI
jgi:crotonobetainyl-CoA:carnitine CoA-transferase CaiB-like acyl-CoA transferase